MVELLPIINNDRCLYECSLSNDYIKLNIGDYFPKEYNFIIKVKVMNDYTITECTFNEVEGKFSKITNKEDSNSYYIYCNNIQTYPQIINIKTIYKTD